MESRVSKLNILLQVHFAYLCNSSVLSMVDILFSSLLIAWFNSLKFTHILMSSFGLGTTKIGDNQLVGSSTCYLATRKAKEVISFSSTARKD